MWNLKYDMNERICGTETDLPIWKTALWLTRGREVGEGRTEGLGLADTNYCVYSR